MSVNRICRDITLIDSKNRECDGPSHGWSWPLDVPKPPVQRHVNNLPNFLFNLPLDFRSAATWPSIGARNGSINIREGNAYLVKLTSEIERTSVAKTLGVCSGAAITTSGLGAVDALTADRTGCGTPEPLLFQIPR